MQKVDGSSPFIRSSETRWKRRVSCFQDGDSLGEIGPRVSTLRANVLGSKSGALTAASPELAGARLPLDADARLTPR